MNTDLQVDLSFLASLGAEILFYLLLLVFTVYGAFMAYHWFSYGTKKEVSLIALATYLIGGAILLITLSILLGTI